MKFACSSCMFTYDESMWEPTLEIDAGTKFEDIGESFCCPWCAGEKEFFAELDEEINYPLDYENLTDLESEHFPIIIDKEEDWVKVQIGEKIHDSNDEHFISSVIVFDEYEDIVEEHILLPTEEAIVTFDIDASEIGEIRLSCNMHGIWWRKMNND